jgi:hypothetical protein
MTFSRNQKIVHWLNQLKEKNVEKIYQVDLYEDKHFDSYLPRLFFITFSSIDFCLKFNFLSKIRLYPQILIFTNLRLHQKKSPYNIVKGLNISIKKSIIGRLISLLS